MKFKTFYDPPVAKDIVLDTDTTFVDQSEADRCSLAFQLERFGMNNLQMQLEKTISQFGYADTRNTSDFATMSQKYAEANQYFRSLPAQIRKEFNHNCVDFYESIQNNPKKMYDRGFISKDLATNLGVKFDNKEITVDDLKQQSADVTNLVNTDVTNSQITPQSTAVSSDTK